MLQVITPTGDRAKAWSFCQNYMERQTYQGKVVWHVSDDGKEGSEMTFSRSGYELAVHRLQPIQGNSQARNLIYLVGQIDPAHPVVFFEDDDAYAEDWLEIVSRTLERAELVGESHARYYNVATRVGRQLNNASHASLCSTAMRGKAIETFRKVCKPGVSFIDINLWKEHRSRYLFRGSSVTGIKGMPGRGGIGMGHKRDFRGQHDPSGDLLRSWIGANAEWYL